MNLKNLNNIHLANNNLSILQYIIYNIHIIDQMISCIIISKTGQCAIEIIRGKLKCNQISLQ